MVEGPALWSKKLTEIACVLKAQRLVMLEPSDGDLPLTKDGDSGPGTFLRGCLANACLVMRKTNHENSIAARDVHRSRMTAMRLVVVQMRVLKKAPCENHIGPWAYSESKLDSLEPTNLKHKFGQT